MAYYSIPGMRPRPLPDQSSLAGRLFYDLLEGPASYVPTPAISYPEIKWGRAIIKSDPTPSGYSSIEYPWNIVFRKTNPNSRGPRPIIRTLRGTEGAPPVITMGVTPKQPEEWLNFLYHELAHAAQSEAAPFLEARKVAEHGLRQAIHEQMANMAGGAANLRGFASYIRDIPSIREAIVRALKPTARTVLEQRTLFLRDPNLLATWALDPKRSPSVLEELLKMSSMPERAKERLRALPWATKPVTYNITRRAP